MRAIEFLTELSYKGNIGIMELVKFQKIATPEQKTLMKELLSKKKKKEALALLNKVTGVELKEEPTAIKIGGTDKTKAKNFIQKVYDMYPGTFQNNHVMAWGEGDNKIYCVFELTPSFTKKDAVEIKWIQALPLRSGAGTKGIQELHRLAKEDGITLTLFPWDKGQVSKSILTKFYKKQGYKPVAKGSSSMYWSPELDEAELDPRGWGSTPFGIDIDYFGLRVQMKPSTFLKLSLPLEPSTSNAEVEKHMRAGGKIAYPMLDIDIPEKEWKAGDFSRPATVTGHEGRNRMTAWIKLHGDDPVQVNIKPKYTRRRSISDEMILALSKGMIGQRGDYISNPFDPNTAK